MSWLDKLKQGMKRTSELFSFSKADEASLLELEEAFIRSDMGYQTASELVDEIRRKKPKDETQMRQIVYERIRQIVENVAKPLKRPSGHKPFIILMVGVNGAGKTTTLGKLASSFIKEGLRVCLVAADTFRAGAVLQLQKWSEKNGCFIETAADKNTDAAALVYDSLIRASARGDDVVMIDTAGRLHNKLNLMDELKKIERVIKKIDPTAPHETVLVLDATVGQNALAQVAAFSSAVSLSGLIMTKLDGTAKGGILIALTQKFGLPVYALGIGEGIDDLQPFTAEQYAASLIGEPS